MKKTAIGAGAAAILMIGSATAVAHNAEIDLSCEGAVIDYTQFAPGTNTVFYSLDGGGLQSYSFTLSGPGLTNPDPLVISAPVTGSRTRTLTTFWTAESTPDQHSGNQSASERVACPAPVPPFNPPTTPPAVPPTPPPPVRPPTPPRLIGAKRAPKRVSTGVPFIYRIRVKNTGGATKAFVRDVLPRGVVLVKRPQVKGGAFRQRGRVLSFGFKIRAGGSRTIALKAVALDSARTRTCNDAQITDDKGRKIRVRTCSRVVKRPIGKPNLPPVTG